MPTAAIAFHPLSFVVERDEVLVGRPDTDAYARFPPDGAALLERLRDGTAPDEAAAWYESAYGQPVDMEDFLATLRDLGFVRDGGVEGVAPRRVVRFQRAGRVLFSRPSMAAYAVAVVVGLVTIVRHPGLRPRPGELVFAGSLVAVQLGLVACEMMGVALHELGHVLAGRRLGVASKVRLGRRLYFLVVETSLDGLLGVPARRRYLPLLAGMLVDAVAWAVLTVVAGAGVPGWVARLALAVGYLALLRILWQAYLFLRTDLYYVVATALGCNDLHTAAMGTFRNWLRSLTGRPAAVDPATWSPRDAAVARWYAPLAIAGMVAVCALGVLGIGPALVELVGGAWRGLARGGDGARFWDAVVFVTLTIVQVGAVATLALRSLRSKGATP